MSAHLTDVEIKAYRGMTLSAERLMALSDHIVACRQCGRRVESSDKLRVACHAVNKDLELAPLDSPEHLDYGKLAGYVDGTLDATAREAVSDHLEECVECAGEIREMAELEARISRDARSQAGDARPQRVAPFLRAPRYRLAAGFAGLAVVALALVFWANARRQPNPRPGAAAPGAPSAALEDGGRVIAMDANFVPTGLDGLPAAYRDAVKRALMTGRISLPPPPETNLGRAGSLLGGSPRGKGFEVVFPVATAVEDSRPVFEWLPVEGEATYTVFVKDLATGAEIEGRPGGGTTWRPGEALVRGRQYAWMVEAVGGGRRLRAPAPREAFATFTILDQDRARELNQARAAWGSSHLVMALVYARTGVRHEAENELQALVDANPESAMAKSLLASVREEGIRGSRR